MVRCDLSVHFDRESRVYFPGETVHGFVQVEVDGEVRCEDLTIETFWRTHGRGNTDEGEKRAWSLSQGENWFPGDEIRLPFEFQVLGRPVSYHGKLVNVDWYVRARADIPWKLDPKAEEDFLVDPHPVDAPRPEELEWREGARPEGTATPRQTAVIAAVFFAVGCVVLYMGMRDGGLMVKCVGGAFMFFSSLIAISSVRGLIAARKLGTVRVEFRPLRTCPGGRVLCRVRFQVLGGVQLRGVHAELRCIEQAVSGAGTDRHTYTEELYASEEDWSGPEFLTPGEEFEASGEFLIPADADYSFRADNNTVAWRAKVSVDVHNWPDHVTESRVLVRPTAD